MIQREGERDHPVHERTISILKDHNLGLEAFPVVIGLLPCLRGLILFTELQYWAKLRESNRDLMGPFQT